VPQQGTTIGSQGAYSRTTDDYAKDRRYSAPIGAGWGDRSTVGPVLKQLGIEHPESAKYTDPLHDPRERADSIHMNDCMQARHVTPGTVC
jgi:hypothetical protein